MSKKSILAAALGLACVAVPAESAVTISITQVGSDVVATASGSIDLTGLTATYNTTIIGDGLNAGAALAFFNTGLTTRYTGFSGPSSWGPGAGVASTTHSGDLFGFQGSDGSVYLPTAYVSGTMFSSSITIANRTLASLGLSASQRMYTSSADQISVNIGLGAVPEPATWALMIGGFGAVGFSMRGRRSPNLRIGFSS